MSDCRITCKTSILTHVFETETELAESTEISLKRPKK